MKRKRKRGTLWAVPEKGGRKSWESMTLQERLWLIVMWLLKPRGRG